MKDIYNISSVEDLKKEFKIFKEAKENVAKILNKKKVTARSWKILYEKYILPKVQEDMYFKDEISKYIFYLVELNGKLQMDFLEVSYDLYTNEKKANKWYKQIVKKIHPDICRHPKAEEAMQSLENLYKGMTRK
ncbi:methyltransferase [uncultured Leptotrichia sp.]|uniref:methyltransferase n=1 Tax=uncultured Leptotrichia sp. TaxID=159271 RepID=UPI0025DC1C70|nr:methyltransferase [uncultured Leptotrichia sp.]